MKKICIFCNSPGKLSKEHLWSSWLHDLLPKPGNGKNGSEVITYQWKKHINTQKQERQGNLTTKKFRVVCQKCNNGWMSKLENEVKPILTDIITYKKITLDTNSKEVLARWIALKSMVGEQSQKEARTTPSSDLLDFNFHKRIPKYYEIYIAKHKEKEGTAWMRISMAMTSSILGPSPSFAGVSRNIQSIAFLCGSLFVYVIAINETGVKRKLNLQFPKLTKIFPDLSEDREWPPNQTISSQEMSAISWTLDDLKKDNSIGYLGDELFL